MNWQSTKFIHAIGVPAPGLVMEVMVKVNDAIESGQPLFQIDRAAISIDSNRAQVARSEASRSRRRASLATPAKWRRG